MSNLNGFVSLFAFPLFDHTTFHALTVYAITNPHAHTCSQRQPHTHTPIVQCCQSHSQSSIVIILSRRGCWASLRSSFVRSPVFKQRSSTKSHVVAKQRYFRFHLVCLSFVVAHLFQHITYKYFLLDTVCVCWTESLSRVLEGWCSFAPVSPPPSWLIGVALLVVCYQVVCMAISTNAHAAHIQLKVCGRSSSNDQNQQSNAEQAMSPMRLHHHHYNSHQQHCLQMCCIA